MCASHSDWLMGANGCHAYPSHLRFGGQSLSRVLVQRRPWGQEGAETGPPRGAWGRGGRATLSTAWAREPSLLKVLDSVSQRKRLLSCEVVYSHVSGVRMRVRG